MSTIAERLKKIRALHGMTQAEFGEKIFLERGHISNIETGKAKPSGQTLKLISILFNVREEWLMNGDEPMEEEKEEPAPAETHLLNRDLLRDVVRLVGAIIEENGFELDLDQLAELYCFLYEDFISKDAQFRNDEGVKKRYVERYLRLMGLQQGARKTGKGGRKTTKKTNVIDIKGRGNVGINVNGDVGKGNKGNIGIGKNVTIKTSTGKIHVMPPPDSIGADPYLKQTITELFNKIGEYREIDRNFGKRAYAVLYKNFKSDFGIKNNPWTIIWTWPKECAPEIIAYLKALWANTIQGRRENAMNREDYIPSRPALYAKENAMLEHFGLQTNSPEVKKLLQAMFGATSHKHITHLQHWQFVKYLEGQLDKIIGE